MPPRPVALHLVDSPCSISPRCAGFSFGRSTYAMASVCQCIGALDRLASLYIFLRADLQVFPPMQP